MRRKDSTSSSLCVFAPLRETASATNAEERLYFFFPLRLWGFAKTASATNAEERLYFVSPLRLCAFAGNSIATKCGAKTLFRLSFAALGLRFYGVAL